MEALFKIVFEKEFKIVHRRGKIWRNLARERNFKNVLHNEKYNNKNCQAHYEIYIKLENN